MLRRTTTLTALVMAVVLVAAGCGDDDDVATNGETSATTTAPEGDGAATEGTTVQVADHSELGPLLVASNGHTLYLFEQDEGTTTACTGACADNWPALAAESPTAGDGVDVSRLEAVDAQVPNHVVYNGHLLYFFAGDTAPGDINGASIADWFPVDPDGNKIESG